LLLRRGEAHVDDLEPLVDRPAQSFEQHFAATGVAGSEHADAHELAVGCKRPDHAGAGSPMTAEVSRRVLLVDGHLVAVDRDRARLLDFADARMSDFDAAVEDAHANSGTLCSSPRPVASDLARPCFAELDPLGGVSRKAPGGERLGHGVASTSDSARSSQAVARTSRKKAIALPNCALG